MNYINKENLPVEIQENELPQQNGKKYEMFYDEKIRTSGGFADAIFLASIIAVAFLWGMLAILLK